MTTERLPRVEARFNVIAPEGGFKRQLRSFDIGARASLDIEIEDIHGLRHWLRITPRLKEHVALSPISSSVYIFTEAQGIFIDSENGEGILTRPVVDVWMEINTEVQVVGMPAGTLKMWEHAGFDIRQLGA